MPIYLSSIESDTTYVVSEMTAFFINFILEREIYMTNIIDSNEKSPQLAKKCADLIRTKKYVSDYMKSTTSVVEGILQMSKILCEIDDCVSEQTLSEYDLSYFCDSVGLIKRSSQYRKYRCIGRNVARFEEYLHLMPESVSVLYEITTLSPKMLEFLIDNKAITKQLTLASLRTLTNKVSNLKKTIPTAVKKEPKFALYFELDKLSFSTRKTLTECCIKLSSCTDVEVLFDEFSELELQISKITSCNDAIDADVTDVEGVLV